MQASCSCSRVVATLAPMREGRPGALAWTLPVLTNPRSTFGPIAQDGMAWAAGRGTRAALRKIEHLQEVRDGDDRDF